MFNFTSKELDVNGNLCEILEKCFDYANNQRKMIENENDSQIRDYRDIHEEQRTK